MFCWGYYIMLTFSDADTHSGTHSDPFRTGGANMFILTRIRYSYLEWLEIILWLSSVASASSNHLKKGCWLEKSRHHAFNRRNRLNEWLSCGSGITRRHFEELGSCDVLTTSLVTVFLSTLCTFSLRPYPPKPHKKPWIRWIYEAHSWPAVLKSLRPSATRADMVFSPSRTQTPRLQIRIRYLRRPLQCLNE